MSPMPRCVLVIEDDPRLGPQLVRHLVGAGFSARLLAEGRLLDAEDLHDVDLVVLDLMLPERHGFDILRHLRQTSAVPVLVLSARNETADKVRGLQLGADDYMTKPFWPEEFVARVQARLRRPLLERQAGIKLGPLELDLDRRDARLDGVSAGLTRVEFELLAALSERPGAAVSRRALAERVLDPDRAGDPRTLDVHVSRLRKKLAPHDLVETVWGIGYRLRAPDPAP